MALILQGYYIVGGVVIASTYSTYKALDYNDKPISLQNIKNNELYDYFMLINKNLKTALADRYIDIKNLKFQKSIKKDYYHNKIKNFNLKNNLSHTVLIVLNIDKNTNNVSINWIIKDKNGRSIQSIETEAKSNTIDKSVIINTQKFINIIKG